MAPVEVEQAASLPAASLRGYLQLERFALENTVISAAPSTPMLRIMIE